jgi:hypothetical protein
MELEVTPTAFIRPVYSIIHTPPTTKKIAAEMISLIGPTFDFLGTSDIRASFASLTGLTHRQARVGLMERQKRANNQSAAPVTRPIDWTICVLIATPANPRLHGPERLYPPKGPPCFSITSTEKPPIF